MQRLQRILGHGVFIALLVGAFFLYSERATLVARWFADPRSAPVQRTVSRPEPEKVLEKRPVTPAVPETGLSLQQRLATARALYWQQDMRGAQAVYRSLLQAYPDNADVWGEAGNFYFSQQQRKAAADAYFHAADLLIRQGQAQRARRLLDVMHQLDDEKTRELRRRLDSTDE